jgi:hypothetical protein
MTKRMVSSLLLREEKSCNNKNHATTEIKAEMKHYRLPLPTELIYYETNYFSFKITEVS